MKGLLMKKDYVEVGDKIINAMGGACYALVVVGTIFATYDTLKNPRPKDIEKKTPSVKFVCLTQSLKELFK